VSAKVVRRLLREGVLEGQQVVNHAPWVIARESPLPRQSAPSNWLTEKLGSRRASMIGSARFSGSLSQGCSPKTPRNPGKTLGRSRSFTGLSEETDWLAAVPVCRELVSRAEFPASSEKCREFPRIPPRDTDLEPN